MNALKVGTLIFNLYVIQSVIEEREKYILYGVENIKTAKRQFIKEFFPAELAVRSEGFSDVTIPDSKNGERFYIQEERFIEAAEIVKHFNNNDAIETIVGSFKQNGTAYVVIEPYEGESLYKEVKRRGAYSTVEALRELMPIIKVLSEINNVGVYHKLCNPKNIICTQHGGKIVNFGYCVGKDMLEPEFLPVGFDGDRWETNTWYDTYSIAATLYFALTGKTPPKAEEHIAHNNLEPISTYAADIDKALEDIIINTLKNTGREVTLDKLYKDLAEYENAAGIKTPTRKQDTNNDSKTSAAGKANKIGETDKGKKSASNNTLSDETAQKATLSVTAISLVVIFIALCIGIMLITKDSKKIEQDIEKYAYLEENSGFKVAFDLASVIVENGTIYTGSVVENSTAAFFGEPGENTNLFKIDKSNIIEAIADINCAFMYATEDSIYFSNVSDNYKLYKITSEGKNIQPINETKTMFSIFYEPNSTIYYTNADDAYKLYTYSFTTKKTNVITDYPTFSLCLKDDTIYYTRGDDGYSLYMYNIKEKSEVKLQEGVVTYPKINGDTIYYINKQGQIMEYSMKDRAAAIYDSDANAAMMDISDSQIVYLTKDKKMVCISLETKEKEVISEEAVDYLEITKYGIIYLKDNNFILKEENGKEAEGYPLYVKR